MLYLHEAQSLHHLFQIWSDTGKTRVKGHPLSPEHVIVPNMDMAQWLQVMEAERTGISANLEFQLPAGFFRKLFESRDESVRKQLLDRHLLRWMIFRLLDDVGPWKSLKDWLNVITKSNSGTSTLTEARWDLASQIADVYDQYLIYRPDWLVQWAGKSTGGLFTGSERHHGPIDQIQGLEGINDWQPELWKRICTNWPDYPNRADLIVDLMQDLRSGRVSANTFHLQADLTIFGVGSLAPAMVEAFALLSQSVDIHWYYRCNNVPQDEMHSYIRGLNEEQVEAKQVILDVMKYHELPFKVISHDPTTTGSAPIILKKPESIVIHRCHSPRREVEVLHDQLLALFDSMEVRPGDVAIVCPDPDVYAPFVREIFGTEGADRPAIPVQINGGKLSKRELVSDVFIRALRLSGSRFKATEMLDWLGLAPVLGDFMDHNGLRGTLNRWVDEHMIRWGSTPGHLSDLGFDLDGRHTWRHGLDRLLLAYTSTENQDYIYSDMLAGVPVLSSGESELLGRLLRLVDVLEQMRRSSREEMSLAEWGDRLESWFRDIVTDPDWLQYSDRSMQVIQTLKTSQSELFTESIPFSVLLSDLNERLGSGGIGRSWSPGEVTCTGMVALHQFPYKVVAVVGLNDGALPGRTPVSTFDIISQNYRPGDRIRRRGDRQLFLDYLYCVSDKLILCYTGYRQIDNKPLAPSVMITSLMDYMERLSRHNLGCIPQEIQHRMQPFHESYFNQSSVFRSYSAHYARVARKLQGTKEVSESLIPTLTPELAAQFLSGIGGGVSGSTSTANETTRFQKSNGAPNSFLSPFRDGLHPRDLIEFYRNPLRFLLRNIHGIDLYEEQVPDEDFEPFELDGLTSWSFRNDLLEMFRKQIQSGRVDRWIKDRTSFKDAITQTYKLQGKLPDGVAGKQGLEHSVRDFQVFWDEFEQKVPEFERLEPIKRRIHCNISEADVALDGEFDTGFLLPSDLPVYIYLSPGKPNVNRIFEYWIRHVLCNLDGTGATRVFFYGQEVSFRPLNRDEALLRIRNLVVMMQMGCTCLVPVIPVFADGMYVKSDLNTDTVLQGLLKILDTSADDGTNPHMSDYEKVLNDVWVRHAWRDRHPLAKTYEACVGGRFFGWMDPQSEDVPISVSASGPGDLPLSRADFATYDAFSLYLVKVYDLMKGDIE